MIGISQSLINEMCTWDYCPQHLKFKFIDHEQGVQTDVMMRGNYFEHFVLGCTRDGQMPEFERVNRKNLKPTKSATKKAKIEYLNKKGVGGTDVEDADLDSILENMPEDRTEGDKPTAQKDLDELIEYAKNILKLLGLDPEKGDTQVEILIDGLIGHLDHVNIDIGNPSRKAIYDLKYTETNENDRFNGWSDFANNATAIIQAKHYIKLYYLKYGVYLPFYFLVFGKTGWVKVFKVNLSEEGMADHDSTIEIIKAQLAELELKDFPAKPKFNKCVRCEFREICDYRSVKPEVEEITV